MEVNLRDATAPTAHRVRDPPNDLIQAGTCKSGSYLTSPGRVCDEWRQRAIESVQEWDEQTKCVKKLEILIMRGSLNNLELQISRRFDCRISKLGCIATSE